MGSSVLDKKSRRKWQILCPPVSATVIPAAIIADPEAEEAMDEMKQRTN